MRKCHGFLDSCDVKKGEVILALLYRKDDEPIIHLMKVLQYTSKLGAKRMLKNNEMWEEIRKTFLFQVSED